MIQLVTTPGTAGGPGGRYRTLTVFFCIYLLDMPKYWGKQIFAHGRFLEVGEKQETERKEKKILQGLRVAQAAVTERWP